MKKKKTFFSEVKEEKWLNEMAGQGFRFIRKKRKWYYFEQAQPGSYQYRVDLLEHNARSQRGKEYLQLLQDSGIHCVHTCLGWAYLEKQTDGEPFDLYSDVGSKMLHYRKSGRTFAMIALSLMLVAALSFALYLWNLFGGNPLADFSSGFVLGMTSSMGVLFALSGIAFFWKAHKLKKEGFVRE